MLISEHKAMFENLKVGVIFVGMHRMRFLLPC